MTVERLEFLSGVVRRRRWSRADKERLVGETLERGVTVTEIARRHDLDRGLLYRWRQELGFVRSMELVGFLPVGVAIDTDTARPEACTGPRGMEIALPVGVRWLPPLHSDQNLLTPCPPLIDVTATSVAPAA